MYCIILLKDRDVVRKVWRKVAIACDQAHKTLQRAFKLDRNDHQHLVVIMPYLGLCNECQQASRSS